MPSYIFYLLKLSASLGIVWLFYQLLLRKLTFYNWNRWYLLVYSLLSFVIPLINITPWVEKHSFGEGEIISYIPVFPNGAASPALSQAAGVESGSFLESGWDLLVLVLLAGAGVLLIRLLIRVWSFQKIRRKAMLIEGMENKTVKLYHVEEDIIPFSFGNAIYINHHLHTEKEWEEIVLHEYVHVRQRHTIDILFAEGLCILNWYNPFAWLIRFAIRQNLEFIADNKVIGNGSDRRAYQYHLLKVVGNQRYRIANNFNFSSLKKRIIMMNKNKSARFNLVRFLFIFPLLAVLLLAFRNKYTARHSSFERAVESATKPGGGGNTKTNSTGNTTANITRNFPGLVKTVPLLPVKAMTPGADTAPGKRSDTVKLSHHGDGELVVGGSLEKILYIVDDAKMPAGYSPNQSLLTAGDIFSIKISRDKAASLYGEKTFKDVVIITTRKRADLDGTLFPGAIVTGSVLPGYAASGAHDSPVSIPIRPNAIDAAAGHADTIYLPVHSLLKGPVSGQ